MKGIHATNFELFILSHSASAKRTYRALHTVSRDKKSAVCIFSLLSLPVCDFYHERVMSVRTFATAVLSFYRTVVDGAFRAMELIIVAIIIII